MHSFRDAEIRIIQEYYRPNGGNPPPAKSASTPVPPGLESKLKRNAPLPTGIAKHLASLPEDLDRRLLPIWEGLRRVAVGYTVLLVEEKSDRVVDMVKIGR